MSEAESTNHSHLIFVVDFFIFFQSYSDSGIATLGLEIFLHWDMKCNSGQWLPQLKAFFGSLKFTGDP